MRCYITVLCLYTHITLQMLYLINFIFKLKYQTICNVCSIIPEAWNNHTVMLSLLCSNMNLLFMALWHCYVTVLCKPLFTYNILPSRLENGILFIKQYFQIKMNNLQRVQYNTIGMEHSGMQMSYMYIGIHVVTSLTPGMFRNILVLLDVTHDATLLLFWL